jgi:hypothetical protein
VGDDLAVLRDAVEKIVLDVSTAQVIVLPLVATGRGALEADHRYTDTAVLTAARGKSGGVLGGPRERDH